MQFESREKRVGLPGISNASARVKIPDVNTASNAGIRSSKLFRNEPVSRALADEYRARISCRLLLT